MSGPFRIPDAFIKLTLPRDLHDHVVKLATARGLDPEPFVEAFRSVYALGFYDGAFERRTFGCLVVLTGAKNERS